jgi:hypothetical protein
MLLHEAHGTCSARTLLERKGRADAHNLFMRAPERGVQEAKWIEERLRRMPERFENGFLRDFGGFRAVRMAAHAVDDDQQGRMLGHCRGHAVLVFFARTEQ